MDYKIAYGKLVGSGLFKEWKEKNSSSYLAHFFGEADAKLNVNSWQVGYYDTRSDLITTFIVGDTIKHMPGAEVFKKEGVVKELDMEKVGVSSDKCMEVAAALQKEKYKQHPIMKGIVILQHLDMLVWNITFITASFAALNIKVGAVKGEVIKHSLSTFFDMQNTPK